MTKRNNQLPTDFNFRVTRYDKGISEDGVKDEIAEVLLEMIDESCFVVPRKPLTGTCYLVRCSEVASYGENAWEFPMLVGKNLRAFGGIRVFPIQNDFYVTTELSEDEFKLVLENTMDACIDKFLGIVRDE